MRGAYLIVASALSEGDEDKGALLRRRGRVLWERRREGPWSPKPL